MKILVVGDWYLPIYEEALYNSFLDLGHEVDKFSWIEYFKYYQYPNLKKDSSTYLCSLYYRIQNRFTIGPSVYKINRDLIRKCKEKKYDFVFIYRGTHIYKNTIKKIKEMGVIIFAYNNDDPFSNNYPKYFWRHFRNSLPLCNHVFAYREKNINEYLNAGVKSVSLLRSYYIKENNYYIENISQHRMPIKIVFIGHYEDDGRDHIILKIAQAGFEIKLFGTGWGKSKYINELNLIFGKIRPIYSEEYNKTLNESDISLVFFSKINNDQYTRRVFEIPITKTVMLSEKTKTMSLLYKENSEILFFNNLDDIFNILNMLDKDRDFMHKIQNNAYTRVIRDGHEVKDRAIQIIETYNKIVKNYA